MAAVAPVRSDLLAFETVACRCDARNGCEDGRFATLDWQYNNNLARNRLRIRSIGSRVRFYLSTLGRLGRP